jgi:glycosyltransferase involved in cell wall biosynthesis
MDFQGGSMRKKIIVRGPVLTQSGYGEQSRFAVRALRAHEDQFDIYIVPTTWGQTGWINSDTEEKRWLDFIIQKTNVAIQNKVPFDVSLQITIPNEWEKLAPINVGFTAGIESDKIDPVWIEKAKLMDRIIVVSNHAKHGFDNTIWHGSDNQGRQVSLKNEVPVDVVNYALRKSKPHKLNLDLATNFNFLAVAQWGPRKNMINTVKWFVEECYDKEVGLILKTSARKNNQADKADVESKISKLLSEYEDRKCKVYLLHGDLTDEELAGLYTHSKVKAIVSLTHGEGFGLPLFEAACQGLPVIAPDWSGQCDFLYAHDKQTKKMKAMFSKVDYTIAPIQDFAKWEGVLHPQSNWCYPEAASYKKQLREMIKDHKSKKKTAIKLQKYLIKEFADEIQYEKFANSVNEAFGSSESSTVRVFG